MKSNDNISLSQNNYESFYYLDNNTYKSCYSLCDSCNKDENIYNCLECISNKGYRNDSIYLNCIKCDENNIFYQKSKKCLDCIYNNKYVDYNQYKCIDIIPDGYYLYNDMTKEIMLYHM